MNRIVILLLALATVSISGGCTSLNGTITSNTDLRSGEPVQYYTPPASNNTRKYSSADNNAIDYRKSAETIAYGTVEDINLAFHDIGSKLYPNVRFKAGVIPTQNGINIDMIWSSPEEFFPLGEYHLASDATQALNNNEGLAFTALTGEAIAKATSKLNQIGMPSRYHIVATYSGSADGAPIYNEILYRGEYGHVNLPARITTLNGTPHEFQIAPGQSISNEELAALRSVSLMVYLNSITQAVEIDNRFETTTHTGRGAQYRTVKVTISIETK